MALQWRLAVQPDADLRAMHGSHAAESQVRRLQESKKGIDQIIIHGQRNAEMAHATIAPWPD
jgi:hypothetical protein